MAASTEIRQYTGAGPSSAAITNLRYKTDDNSSGTDTTYPLVKPAVGTNYSYLGWIALYAASGPAGSITNVKFYTDGSSGLGTGISIRVNTTNSYYQATGTQGVSGSTGDGMYAAGTDAFTYTSGSPLSVSSNATTGTGRLSYYIVSQMAVSTSVTPGTTPTETFTIRYDET